MIIAVPTETFAGERRVALVPAALGQLAKADLEVAVQTGAGLAAGYEDDQYKQHGARLVADRRQLFEQADVIAQVRTLGANPEAGQSDLELFKSGQIVIGHAEPLTAHDQTDALAQRGVTLMALEMLPRITRAQSMDVLSSMASLAGYKAVLLAADALPKIFPMMMTAAGTITAAKVFVIGAGVAGLQAIATAKRLGAVVSAFDVRAAVKEQVESLGAKFIELKVEAAEGAGGYAREQTEDERQKQQELMASVIAESDVVITTAAVPGRKAPVLVSEAMVRSMHRGSVIVDLAAERGGNCQLTEAGQTVDADGVQILGPTNLPATMPFHASQMYARNIVTFLLHLVSDGQVNIDTDDEITRETLIAQDSQVVNNRVREAMNMPPLERAGAPAATPEPPQAAEDAAGDRSNES